MGLDHGAEPPCKNSLKKNIDRGKLTRCVFSLQVVVFDGGEYVSMAGEFNEFRKVQVF